MNYRRLALRAALIALFVTGLVGFGVKAAFAATSHVSPSGVESDTTTLYWSGQGTPVNQQCGGSADPGAGGYQNGATATSYMLWIFTTDGGDVTSTPPTLTVNGVTYGNAFSTSTSTWQIVTPYIDPSTITQADKTNQSSTGSAYTTFTVNTIGNGSWGLKISHGCGGTAAPPTVMKTASGSYDTKYTWTVTKSADTTTVYSAGGGPSSPVHYTVNVSHDAGTIINVKVTGTITVTNPNPTDPIAITGVTDTLSDGTPCAITGVPSSLPVGATPLNYECDLSGLPTSPLTNTVEVDWGAQTLPHDGTLAAGSASFTTPTSIAFTANPTPVDGCLTVSDKLDTTGPHTFCVGDPGDPNFSFQYSATFTDPNGTCSSDQNTATGVTNTTSTEVDSNTVMVTDCQGADLTVTKTATPSFTRTYGWSILKSVDKAKVTIDPGSSATFNYTVNVSHDSGTDSAFAVSGTITVANPNDWEDVSGVNVSDSIDNGGSCTVQQSSGGVNPANATIPRNGSVDFPYTCTFGSNPGSGTNTATATWDAATYHTPDGTANKMVGYTFGAPTTVKGNCFTVSDTFNGGSPLTLGTACIDPTSWTTDPGNTLANFQESFNDPTFTFTYSRTIQAPTAGTCVTYPNTAMFTTNNGAIGSSGQSVQVCAYQPPLTIGYWGNHLAQTGTSGCSNNGPWAKTYLPQPLGGYSVTSFPTVAKVIAANNCSNASSSSQNAVGCLAAQLLAAELNVAHGANACIVTAANGINNANSFLSSGTVGGVAGITYTGPSSSYSLTTAQRNEALVLKNELVNYNQGGGC